MLESRMGTSKVFLLVSGGVTGASVNFLLPVCCPKEAALQAEKHISKAVTFINVAALGLE